MTFEQALSIVTPIVIGVCLLVLLSIAAYERILKNRRKRK